MRTKAHAALIGVVVVAAGTGMAVANGKIVIANDEWTLSNAGFAAAPDTAIFAQNIANWFSGGSTGSFLAYSNSFGLVESSLASTMTGAGHSWSVSTAVQFDLQTLSQYDGVFLGGRPNGQNVDTGVLIDYVNAGGNVYVMGGSGLGGGFTGAADEAAAWNPFLNAFGLGFADSYNPVSQIVSIQDSSPIFSGVGGLYQHLGQDIFVTDFEKSIKVLIERGDGANYYAAVPTPGTLGLLALGGLVGARRRRPA